MRGTIEARGVRVHNLQSIDVDVPLGQLTVVVGVSGSGKSSLAFDTLYAEGQRRYIESFSTWARQFLDRLPRPDADRIDGLPPAIAIRQHRRNLSRRATVSTATEIDDFLRLLFARLGTTVCPNCRQPVRRHTADDITGVINGWESGVRFFVAFDLPADEVTLETLDQLQADGFARAVSGGRTWRLDSPPDRREQSLVVIDRLKSGQADAARVLEAVETAWEFGDGRAILAREGTLPDAAPLEIDGHTWSALSLHENPACPGCGERYEDPEPQQLSFNSPLGACSTCSGFGTQSTFEFDKVVPDASVSLKDGAIAPWTTPAYRHEQEELLALAADYDIPVEIPFSELGDEHRALISGGVPERDFGGLEGFFAWLERNRYKKGVGVFLNRWRSWRECETCHGTRLSSAARAIVLAESSISDISSLNADQLLRWCESLELAPHARVAAEPLLREITNRARVLAAIGLSYLTLDRPLRTLSGGESQRVSLTSALGSSLVNALYVLDEPTTGLHPCDTERVITATQQLRDLGNTLVVVEHDAAFIRAADHIVEVGPGAGRSGGRSVYQGPVSDLPTDGQSPTGSWLGSAGTAAKPPKSTSREPRDWLELTRASTHNLRDISARIPLGLLCVVTGVSGSGKSSLVRHTLFPALSRKLGLPCALSAVGNWGGLTGGDELANVVEVDHSPLGRTSRSVPVTWLGAFTEIRKIFSETSDARLRDRAPGYFSFNSAAGGRCPKCEGHGQVSIDMQFMADVAMTCPECAGTRYRPEVLEIRYRGLTIADVLDLSADDAFTLFRGRHRLQRKLKVLRDAGLGYLPLGQPATSLSGGETQRLRLASHLAATPGRRKTDREGSTLFLLDEPTAGLHGQDIALLLQCFDGLLSVGHSLLVVEHNLDVIRAADHIIELGPGAGADGGTVVGVGTPADIANLPESVTGPYLSPELRT